MKSHQTSRPKHRAFTLTELVVVLSVFGVILSTIWGYAQSARQSTKIEQSIEAITEIVESTRAAYIAAPSVAGGTATVMQNIVNTSSFPYAFLNTSTTTCNGITIHYANNPWGNSAADGCGTLAVCAWTISTNKTCANISGSSQYFAIEFSQLDYGSCVSLVETLSSSQPTGLKDVFINSASGTGVNGLPVAPSVAAADCKTTIGGSATANVVDFIYSLRAPLT